MQSTLRNLSLSLLLAACGGSTEAVSEPAPLAGGSGTLTLHLTDAPLDPALVAEARIDVERITIQDGDEDGFRTLYEGDPLSFDLVDLRNGVTSVLVRADVPEGRYRQLRLVFHDAYLRLTNGNEYLTADGSLRLTSQATSGLKVFVDPPLDVGDGVAHDLLLDVDLSKTFRPIPANEPENAERFHLGPVIRAVNLAETGEVRGRVRRDDGNGGLENVPNASVYLFEPGVTDLDDAIASTVTGPAGGYAFLGVEPGDVDVFARKDDQEDRASGFVVVAGSVTAVDLELE